MCDKNKLTGQKFPVVYEQTAADTLKYFVSNYSFKLALTFFVVLLENVMLIAYPVLAGYAVDAIMRGDPLNALFYAGVVFSFWVVGALRRVIDTRIFTRMYANFAVSVVIDQRLKLQDTSTIFARVVLARDFVDFFEKHVPIITTSLISIIGAALMLVLIERYVGLACIVTLLVFILLTPHFLHRNQELHRRVNNRLEHEVSLISGFGLHGLTRHYQFVSRLRIILSDRDAVAFLFIGLVAALLFCVAIVQLGSTPDLTAGHIYAVMTYLWTFVSSLDQVPSMADQMARLKDIGKRISPTV